MPTGRGIAGLFNGVKILNLYATSGSEKRNEREKFYNLDVPRLLHHPESKLIFAGDFNCVLKNTDTTGKPTLSRALNQLISGLDLYDAWEDTENANAYTHYTQHGASRLDRIYISRTLLPKKKHTELRATAFTDHFAVVIFMEGNATFTTRGRGFWKLNTNLLCDKQIHACFKKEWES